MICAGIMGYNVSIQWLSFVCIVCFFLFSQYWVYDTPKRTKKLKHRFNVIFIISIKLFDDRFIKSFLFHSFVTH